MACLIPSFATPSKGQVVEITKEVIQHGNKTLALDENAIEKVFGQKNVANSPVAIYCIVGMLRKGKSFFLNTAIRYLKFKFGERTGSWLDDKTAKINEGFEWRGGVDAHTKGILIWSEPFWVDTPQYGKVAVFLMDTQGIGDNMSSPVTDANLFSLSTLFSSYLIYNTDSVMNRTDLDQFKDFTDFARKLQNNNNQKLNQSLLFLRRDWGTIEYALGFEGGTKYLNKVFHDFSNTSEHYNSLCANIKSSFKEVKCALLPHPGKKFIKMSTTPTLADLDDDFLEELEKLLQDLFVHICVKMNGEYPTTGEDLINQAIILAHHMKTNYVDADMLLKVVSENFLSNIIARCEEKFAEDAKRLTDIFFTNDDLLTYHEGLIKKVLAMFDREMKVSSKQKQEDNRNSLEVALIERRFILKNYNDVCKQGIQDLYRALVNDILQTFKDAVSADFELNKRTDFRYIEESQFEETMKVKINVAISLFDETISNFKLSDDACTSYRENLENELNLQKNIFKSLNYSFMFQMERDLSKAYIRAIEELKRSWEKKQENDVQIWLFSTVEALLKSFKFFNVDLNSSAADLESFSVDPSSTSDNPSAATVIEKSKEKVTKNLYNLAHIYARGSEIKRTGQAAGWKVNFLFATIRRDFKEKVSKASMIDMTTEERKKVYFEIREKIFLTTSKQHTTSKDKDLLEDCRETILLLFKNLEEECEFENQLSKDKYFLELLTVKAEIAHKINQLLDVEKKSQFWVPKFFSTKVESKLDQLVKEKADLIKEFSKLISSADGERWDLVAETKKSVDEYFDQVTETAKQQDSVQKMRDQEAAKKIQRIFIMRYTKQMEKMLRKTKVKNRQLKDVHESFLSDYKSYAQGKFGSEEEAAYSKFKEKMEVQFCKWSGLKRFHKKVYRRKFAGISEVVFKAKKNLQAWFEEDPSGVILRKMPLEWVFPETGFCTKSGELTPKFRNLKLLN